MYEHGDILTLLENANLGTVGKDIFAYHSPPEAGNCIIVYPSNDPPQVDPERPFYYRAKFQIIVRNSDYSIGIDVCKAVQEALTLYNADTAQMTIKELRPLYQARIFRRGGAGDIEMSINFSCIYVTK
jgi:hypothetical protein